jgi:iron complex transport system permease protein
VLRAWLAAFGLASPLAEPDQTILMLRVWRALVASGVGAALAYSGALLQGLFRNPLAAPSLIGVTGGASLGATIAILVLGGYGAGIVAERGVALGVLMVPTAAFLGALVTVAIVALLAAPRGRLATSTLLLFGIAVNMCVAGVFAAIQSLVLRDWEVSRAIMSWTFGTLDDRTGMHAATIWVAIVLAAAAAPFVALELDLLQGGEDDARSLGVPVVRVKVIALVTATLAAGAATAVAGQIAFIGLMVPHVVRLIASARHKVLLPLSLLGGAVFLLGADALQRGVFGEGRLQPGVLMSLIGGPFFVYLLVRRRREVGAW